MSGAEFGKLALTLAILLASAHALGYLAERLRQPRLVGEILAGVLLGPFVLKLMLPDAFALLFQFSPKAETALGMIYQLGLILLMFCSGTAARRLLAKENQRQTFTLIGVADVMNFTLVLSLGFAGLLPLAELTGTANQEISTLLVLAIAVAVTSIPVISRIFWDLRIMHTRFVSLILGSAVLEDVALWTVLAVATAIAKSATLANQHVVGTVTEHVAATFAFVLFTLILLPRLLKRLSAARWNLLYSASPVGYVVIVLLASCGAAALFDINLQFAALLSGYALVGGISGSERERFAAPLDAVAKVSFGIFIPIYFALIGYRLVFGHEFSFPILIGFFVGSTILSLITSGLAARLAGFRKLDIINISLTTNARGGPGIVLASVAYDAGIINGGFFTALVLTAVLTSQMAGSWLRFVLNRGWPLLASNPDDKPLPPEPEAAPAPTGTTVKLPV
ncbi:cation:proton antiporter [Ferrovibrio sp.]|uniref:cation:proton antiporter n=1 Tax=Ferrovibrio sp. TaxID=1917215 RepID=UPI0035AE2731